MRVNFVIIQCR